MKLLFHIIFIIILAGVAPAFAREPNIAELRQITQAGGSLILDLDSAKYTTTELKTLAESLKYQATLTIKMSGKNRLTATQCAQITQSQPGRVVFWF